MIFSIFCQQQSIQGPTSDALITTNVVIKFPFSKLGVEIEARENLWREATGALGLSQRAPLGEARAVGVGAFQEQVRPTVYVGNTLLKELG
jgi:hypothetical protein